MDGVAVPAINPDLTAGTNLTRAHRLRENAGIAFYSDVKAGPFDIPESVAREMLAHPNPDGRSNEDVVRPWVNGRDVTGRTRGMWIIDFGVDMPEAEAALYEAPFEYVRAHVLPIRAKTRRDSYRRKWWLHAEPCAGMRTAIASLQRHLVTPSTAKHRIFAWMPVRVLADHALVVVAREDDATFGILQSRVHEAWARATGTQLREAESGFRYTPTSTFETFPFPRPSKKQAAEVAAAAKALHDLREGWLNPPGLPAAELKKRTLTNLYNARPAWLAQAHDRLDHAVLAAYGWPHDITDEDLLAWLLSLNLEREPT